MTVVLDNQTESHSGATGSISQASFTWNVGFGTTRGILVFVVNLVSNADIVSSVTFDGLTVPAVSGGAQGSSTAETGYCAAYFLGSGIPSGNKAVVVNRTNNTDELWAVAITVTAGGDTEVYTAGIVLLTGVAA